MNHRFVILVLAQVELRSAVRRRERSGDLAKRAADELLGNFARHLETKSLRQTLNEVVLEAALGLIERYPLRAYDAMQQAGCLVLRATMNAEHPVFISADQNQLEAADMEGLVSLNPCS